MSVSGGSYDYAFHRLHDLALEIRSRAGGDERRLAFAAHLDLCARAARAIEWVDSGDYARGDDHGPIDAVLLGASRS